MKESNNKAKYILQLNMVVNLLNCSYLYQSVDSNLQLCLLNRKSRQRFVLKGMLSVSDGRESFSNSRRNREDNNEKR